MPSRNVPRHSLVATGSLLTTKEVAAFLRVHPKHVYRLMRRHLPALRVGDEWRFDRDQVTAWAEARGSDTAVHPRKNEVPALVAANGDLVVDALLGQCVRASAAPFGFVLADHTAGARLLHQRLVLAAGSHAGIDVRAVRRVDRAPSKAVRLQLVVREVGVAAARGARIGNLGVIVGKRVAIRPATSGLRKRLDHALGVAGIDAGVAYRRAIEHSCHRDVALAVARGDADFGLTTHAWAHAAGLSFRTIAIEEYDLCFLADHVDDPRVLTLCEVAQSAAFTRRLRDCAGYDASRAGRVRPV